MECNTVFLLLLFLYSSVAYPAWSLGTPLSLIALFKMTATDSWQLEQSMNFLYTILDDYTHICRYSYSFLRSNFLYLASDETVGVDDNQMGEI